jgi:hypothetical protein
MTDDPGSVARSACHRDDLRFTHKGEPPTDAELEAAGYLDVVLDEYGWPLDYRRLGDELD